MPSRRHPSAPVHVAAVLVAACAAGAAALAPSRAAAQATDATIRGAVRGENGLPIPDAQVTLRNGATGFTTAVTANARGEYSARQLPLGGPYTVTVRRLGFRPVARGGLALRIGDQLQLDFVLPQAAIALESVVVTADTSGAAVQRFGQATRIGERELQELPVEGRDFSSLAQLDPTTVQTGGRDLSIGGQRGTATEYRIDGMSTRRALSGGTSGQGPYTLSLASIAEFEVVRNVYDVTNGRSGGGINAVTRSGTNTWAATAFGFHRNDALTTRDYTGRAPSDFQLTQWGGSLAGPIVRNRAHFFLSYEQQDESRPFFIGDIRNADDELAFRVNRDSVTRMLDILQRNYGLQDPARQVGRYTLRPDANALFGRVDWQLAPSHRLTVRNNLTRWTDPRFRGGDQPITLLESREGSSSTENSSLVSLRSNFSPTLDNELKLGVLVIDRENTPNTLLPRGFVRIRSQLPNGTTGDTRVQFGGNRLSPSAHYERQLQLSNVTYWQAGRQLVTLGTDILHTALRSRTGNNQGGLFEFESLADLEAMRPNRYSRQAPLGDPAILATPRFLTGALFAQTEFTPARNATLIAGLRWDVNAYLNRPAYNPRVEQLLGIRTDQLPAPDWRNVQPRVQLEWDPTGSGRQSLVVGGGAFNAQALHWTTVNSFLNTGTYLADITLTGAAVPAPDFVGYRQNPLSVPGAAQGAPSAVDYIGAGFRTPVIWKGNAAYRVAISPRLSLGVNALVSSTRNNYHYFDRNLVTDPLFTIEGGRGVLVPAATIDARGRTNPVRARRTSEFAQVLELVPAARATNRALVTDAAIRLPRDAALTLSYTLNETRDNASFNCCNSFGALDNPVKGDPRDLASAWGASNYDFRHKVVGYGTLPRLVGFQLSGRYVGSSATPFSLVVNGDVNGDGNTRNDLAFVFDPDDPATPPDVAEGMRRVLANPESFARDHIRAGLGRIADRNGGRGPWQHRLDLRLARTLAIPRGQSVEVLAEVFNFANLLNREWGASYSTGVRQSLLNVVGFDQAARRFVYEVNENVGVVPRGGDPYQIQLGARYAF